MNWGFTMKHALATMVMAALVGCGGGGDSSSGTTDETYTPPPDTTSGAEDPPADPVEAPMIEPEPEPTGPGRLTVGITVAGESVAGNVVVADRGGDTVAEGSAGQTFSLPAGEYRVFGEITDASILADRPTREAEEMIDLAPGQQLSVNVEHGRSRVKLNVVRNGRPVANWRMELRRQGTDEVVLELRSGMEHTAVSPGRYDGVVHFGASRIDVSGIIFQGGATQEIPVRVQ